jgi:FkbM family methyltransferase
MMKNLIHIDRFDNNTGLVYFKYLGEETNIIKVRISSKDLTLYYTELELNPDINTTYYVGFNESIIPRIDSVDVTFWNPHFVTNDNFKIRETKENLNLPQLHTKINDPSYYSFDEIFGKKVYKNKLVKINEGDVVVDIGGNYGFFSLYAEKFKPSKIITFEPSKTIFSYLTKNFKNGSVIQRAVSGKTGVKRFTEHNTSSTSSRITDDGEYDVNIIGINDLIPTLGLEKIDFLKIDCEGAEKEIFEEITLETISKINKIVVEFHSQEIKEIIINKLNLLDYKIESVTQDLIFAHKKDYYKNKKKIALISTYCDTQEKKDVFLDLVKKVKSFGIDVMAISPLPLDEEHIKACDYLFFTKENPILGWPTRLFTFWREYEVEKGKILTLQRGVGDYSWAALYHVKKLTQIALDYDYEIFYHMIYDLEIDEHVASALNNFGGDIVYPRRNPNHPETIWETTLHLMSFDRDLMKEIEKEITLNEYLSTNGVAEGEVYKWKKKFDIYGSDIPVKDKIYYWKDFDFFDYSPVKDFKMFLSRNEPMDIWLGEGNSARKEVLSNNLRVVFYGSGDIGEITLKIDDFDHKIEPKPLQFIELPINSREIKKITMMYKGEEYDLTDEYGKIMLNQIYFNYR